MHTFARFALSCSAVCGLMLNPPVPGTFAEFDRLAAPVYFWTFPARPGGAAGAGAAGTDLQGAPSDLDLRLRRAVEHVLGDIAGFLDEGGPHNRFPAVGDAARRDLADPDIARHLGFCRGGLLNRSWYKINEEKRHEAKTMPNQNVALAQKAGLLGCSLQDAKVRGIEGWVTDPSGSWDWRFSRARLEAWETSSGERIADAAERALRGACGRAAPPGGRWLGHVTGVNVYPPGGFREWHTDAGNQIGWRLYMALTQNHTASDRPGGLGAAHDGGGPAGGGNFTFLGEGPASIVLFRVSQAEPFWHCVASPDSTRFSLGLSFRSREATYELIRALFGAAHRMDL